MAHIVTKSVPAILVLILFDFFVFFQKYAMISIHKDLKILVNIHYFENRSHTFLPYKINLLG